MRIFLAATSSGGMTEEDKEKAVNIIKPKYYLETFFEGEEKCLEALKLCGNTENFLLDSGAFSYMSGAKCDKKKLIEYCDKYIDFINKYDIKYFFELDVDTIFGIEFVEELRQRIENRTGKKVIPVWHKGRGVEYWKKMCDNYKYVAIGGLVFHVKKQEWELIKKMINYAYKKGVKVHGLGFTKTKIMDEFKFYSVDSSSWKISAIRGQQLQTFNGKNISQRKIDGKGKRIILSRLIAHNMVEWTKYQRYMDRKKW